MIRAFLVIAGLVMVATRQTPFDMTGVHLSPHPFVELSLCAVALVAALASTKD